jgi:NADH:ubiquinone oxidoreductase subunit 6 (subunit J)
MGLPVLVGLVAVCLLLPRPRGFPAVWGAVAGAAAVLLAGWLLVWRVGFSPEGVLFYAFAAVAVVSGGLLVTQVNPVHAALSFALVVLSTCGLFLLLGSPFLMAATVIVYAGAIVVTFLFVIMLAQQEGLSDADQRSREPLLSTVAGFVLLGALLFVLQRTYDNRSLDALVGRTEDAAGHETLLDLVAALGDEDRFFADWQREAESAHGSRDSSSLKDLVINTRGDWEDWKKPPTPNVTAMRNALEQIAKLGGAVRDSYGALRPDERTVGLMSPFGRPPAEEEAPPETVAPLGRVLFTEYLIAVELGGTLLLVATIGAIVIAGRHGEVLR